jgi:hypothetical protein
MYALWIMCLEDDGCNRLQMQLAGVYEWVQGWIRNEMYRVLDKGWPLANAGNSCAMWVFWYLTTKARLIEESEDQKESLIELVLPFLTVPFRYPSAFAPANHFRLPLRSSVPSASTPMSIPTPHGPFPIYLHPDRHTWITPHFERWTPLCTPLASDAAKLVYFSRRETMLFTVPSFYPRNREDHRNRVRARLAAENDGQVDESEVERVFRSELPKPTQEDFEELNAGLLGGDMVEPSSSSRRGGGTPLPRAFDPWDDVRLALPSIVSDSDLEAAERILGGEIDESACSSRRWDTDWWRLRLARSAWISTGTESEEHEQGASSSQEAEIDDDEPEVITDEEDAIEVEKEATDDESDMKRSPTMLTGYPQKGAVYSPGALTGLWTGRMVIPSETHLRALLLPPQAPAHVPPAFVPNPNPNGPNVPLGPDGAPIPNPDPNDPNAALLPDLAPEPQPQEAGHRPLTFTEDTLRLVAVPLYVRLEEYAVFSGGESVPCANDTMDIEMNEDGSGATTSAASGSGSGSGISTDALEEASYDQGMRDAWFPPNTTFSTKDSHVVVSVPPGRNNMRVSTDTEQFTYVKIGKKGLGGEGDTVQDTASPGRTMGSEAEARSKRQPGTFHDPDTCPGCLAREQALLAARVAAEAEAGDDSSEESEDIEPPPYVPSPETIPLCDGIRDVVLTGSTDPRHAAAWGKWAWKGRVRSWDGLVGLVRSADTGLASTGGAGKIFFYGTLVGGRNLIGTWRLANEDPRMPAYEGAFTLGRKDES